MPEKWMLDAAQALLKSAAETEDLSAKATMLQTAAELMIGPVPEPDAYEDE